MVKIVALTLALAFFVFPQIIVFGQTNVTPEVDPITIASEEDIGKILDNIVDFLYKAFFAIAILFILIAAFRYLTAGGNPANLEKANKMLLYAVIAIIVALIAFALPVFISNVINRLAGRGG